MEIVVISVGKPRDRSLAAIHDDYGARLRRLGLGFRARSVRETAPGGKYSDDHVRLREAEALRRAWGGAGRLVALDRTGEQVDSRSVADKLQTWTGAATTFVIGGPLGLHASLLQEASWVWSLSPLTFPHEIARVLLVEQLYRAATIARGFPYHK